jgi:exonuclease VII large subunit
LKTVVEFHRAGCVVEVRRLRDKLDDLAETMEWRLVVQPGVERHRVDELYAALLASGHTRLNSIDDLAGRAHETESHLVALVARQHLELQALLQQAEHGMQHVLTLAVASLATTYTSVQAFDIDALLQRGLTIAVRDDGSLIKSAAEASQTALFKLLFADGVVAVVPGSTSSATVH